MHRLPALLVTALALALPAAAAAAPADPGGPLVYVFSFDGLDGDRVDAGLAPNLSAYLKGQGARATYFQESRSIFVAETNPNHTAMGTGAYGDASGIPGNAFALYGQTRAEPGEPSLEGDTNVAVDDSCILTGPIDESKPPTETSGESPNCLLAETFFQTIQAEPGREALVTAGIFGKPKLGRIFAGRRLDARRYDADYLWTPCPDFPGAGEAPPYCDPNAPSRPLDSYALDDSTVMDEVRRTVRDGVQGDGRTFTQQPESGELKRPQLTFVNFPAIDTAGHTSGTDTGAYNQMIADLDGDLKAFVDQQKALGLWERTTMVVLSDHAMETTANKTTLGTRFAELSGVPESAYTIVQNGSAALVYLNNRAAPDAGETLKKLRAAALSAAQPPALPPVGPPAVEALYRLPNPADGGDANTLGKVHPGYNIAGPRTGDLVVNSAPGAAFNEGSIGNPLVGNHGGGQTRDNFLAVVGGAPAIRQGIVTGARAPLFDDTLVNVTSAENVDVAPTVLRLLSRPAPAQSKGRLLTEAFDVAQLPPPVPRTGAVTPGTTPAGMGPNAARRTPATLRLLQRRVRASRTGRITLRLMCSGADGQSCARTLAVRRDKRTIARRKLTLRAGSSARVVLRLDARSRRSLARRGTIRGTVLGGRLTVLRARP